MREIRLFPWFSDTCDELINDIQTHTRIALLMRDSKAHVEALELLLEQVINIIDEIEASIRRLEHGDITKN